MLSAIGDAVDIQTTEKQTLKIFLFYNIDHKIDLENESNILDTTAKNSVFNGQCN